MTIVRTTDEVQDLAGALWHQYFTASPDPDSGLLAFVFHDQVLKMLKECDGEDRESLDRVLQASAIGTTDQLRALVRLVGSYAAIVALWWAFEEPLGFAEQLSRDDVLRHACGMTPWALDGSYVTEPSEEEPSPSAIAVCARSDDDVRELIAALTAQYQLGGPPIGTDNVNWEAAGAHGWIISALEEPEGDDDVLDVVLADCEITNPAGLQAVLRLVGSCTAIAALGWLLDEVTPTNVGFMERYNRDDVLREAAGLLPNNWATLR